MYSKVPRMLRLVNMRGCASHTARTDRKYQSPLCANMAYIFENYIPVETFWCKIWIHTCTILGISMIFTTVAQIFD